MQYIVFAFAWSVLFMLGTMVRVEATTLTPTVFVETFPTNFLETVNCAMLRRGQKLSVDPMSLPPGKTWNIGSAETLSSTQGERRSMLQTRLYTCTVDAIQAFDIALPQLGVGSAAYNSALTKLKMAREGTNWPSTPGWLAMTLVKYHQGVRNVLFYTAGPNLYVLEDDSYPWTYPENAIYLLNQILTIFTQNHIPSPLSADLQAFVTQTAQHGRPFDQLEGIPFESECIFFGTADRFRQDRGTGIE
jgi:hypothetical protein